MEVREKLLDAGVPASVEAILLLARTWEELPELQNRSKSQYIDDSLQLMKMYDRIELTVYDDADQLVGGGVLIELVDIHYGTVVCLMHCVGQKGAGRAVLAYALRLAKKCEYKWFSRSSRVSATEYRQLYRRL
jgi:hypothetical protein